MSAKRNPQFNVRIPPELKEKVAALAERNKRSVNAEIVAALELVCRKAFGEIIEHDDGVELILNERDSKLLESSIETLKKVSETEKKLDELMAELKKLNSERVQ
ncbi:Arc family DNA-binding protein [Pectobacterium brasiliense]|uniref:Arc family DNA-binding protein n=1 Tax=Pectobacterium brasiliense TaxID=180957 RepID=UPI0015DDE673|nr:Arc family DNA-binding protein [Pectobacterium brasiliense]MBA0216772.1 Arc family DNA-binding protein [Pectobacterium brasiliense]MBN3073316.1 Arc family DNA-binding protein [Pectobacterium brasiliense]MBN3169152.1 Arc family DNA-binding protein [Pectobacterium brasiliense]